MDFLIKALEELTVGMEKKGILHQEGMERGRTYLNTIPSWPSPATTPATTSAPAGASTSVSSYYFNFFYFCYVLYVFFGKF